MNRIVPDQYSHNKVIVYLKNTIRVFFKHELSTLAELFGYVDTAWLTTRYAYKRIAFVTLPLIPLLGFMLHAQALPEGFQSINGNVTFTQNGQTLDVSTQSQQSIAEYLRFNIGQDETVNFNLPNSHAAILNRVTGGDPSQILGRMNSNGNVFLVNPSGIFFGNNAQINVQSLTASTLNIQNDDFLAGRYTFERSASLPPGSIINHGHINAASHVVLIGGAIENTGTISAKDVRMAVGDKVTMQVTEDVTVDVTVDQSLQDKVANVTQAIHNSGTIKGQDIQLKANLSQALYETTVNNDGVIEATGLAQDTSGKIIAVGETDTHQGVVVNAGTMLANGTGNNPNGGRIELHGDHVSQEGQLLAEAAENGTGGHIELVSKNETTLAANSLTSVKGAGDHSSAGDVYVWSDKDTHFQGRIDASGGRISGNAGSVEVSGKDTVYYQGYTDLRANNGNVGSLLVDPVNINIATGDPTYDPGIIGAQSGNLTFLATNNLTVSNAVDFTSASSVILQGNNSVNINAGVTTHNAPLTVTGGSVSLASTGSLNSNNGAIAINGTSITVDGNINAGTNNVTLTSTVGGNNVNLNSTSTISANNFTVQNSANSYINYNGANLTGVTGTILFDASADSTGQINITSALSAPGDVTLNFTGTNTINADISAGRHLSITGAVATNGNNVTLTANSTGSGTGLLTLNNAVTTTNGNLTLKGDSVAISSTINAGAGTVTLAPTRTRAIRVASATSDDATYFDVTTTELGRLTAGTVTIGDTTKTGGLTISNDINIGALGYNLNLNNGGDITTNNRFFTLGTKTLNFNTLGAFTWGTFANNYALNATNITANDVNIYTYGTASPINIGGNLTANNSLSLWDNLSAGVNIGGNLTDNSTTGTTTLRGPIIIGGAFTLGSGSTKNLAVTLGAGGNLFSKLAAGNLTLQDVTISNSTNTGSIIPGNLTARDVTINNWGNTAPILIQGDLSGRNISLNTYGSASDITVQGNLTASGTLALYNNYSTTTAITGNLNSTGTGNMSLDARSGIFNLGGSMTIASDSGKDVFIQMGTGTALNNKLTGASSTLRDITLQTSGNNTGMSIAPSLTGRTILLQTTGTNSSIVLPASIIGSGNVTLSAGGSGSSLNGTATSALTADSTGVNAGNLSLTGALSTNNGNLTLKGAQIALNSAVNAGTGTVTIAPTMAKSIRIAGNGTDDATFLDINTTELGRITAGTLSIGDSALASPIVLAGNIDVSGRGGIDTNSYNLSFNTAGSFSNSGYTINLGRDALDFNGSNATVMIPGSSVFDLSSNYTFSAWVRTRSTATDQDIINIGDTNERIYMYLESGKLVFGSKNNGAFTYTIDNNTTATANQWMHVVGVMDASQAGNNRFRLYANGTELTNRTTTWTNGPGTTNTNTLLGSGYTDGGQTFFFNGQIDDARIYNQSLSASDVTALYNNGVGQTVTGPTTGLVAGYNFNEGSGLTVADVSGNNNTGTLVNSPTWVAAKNLSINATGSVNTGSLIGEGSTIAITSGNTITVDGTVAATGSGTVSLVAPNNLTINAGKSVYAGGTGDSLILASTNGTVINNAGAGAVSAPNGRWTIYSDNPANTVEGGLTYNKRYDTHYGDNVSAYSGNYFFYRIAPTLTVTATNQTKIQGANNPALGGTITGFIDGDTMLNLSGVANYSTLATATSGVGTYAINSTMGTLLSNQGYHFTFINGLLTISPASVTIQMPITQMLVSQPIPYLLSTIQSPNTTIPMQFQQQQALIQNGFTDPSLTSSSPISLVQPHGITLPLDFHIEYLHDDLKKRIGQTEQNDG